MEDNLIQEKTVCTKVYHPFIMNFYKTFIDDTFIYFLFEYIKGMELFDVIRVIGLLDSYQS